MECPSSFQFNLAWPCALLSKEKRITSKVATARIKPTKDLIKILEKDFVGFCTTCNNVCRIVPINEVWERRQGITSKSAKQKGRRAQQKVRDDILETFKLTQEDVESVSLGLSGRDIKLSPHARKIWPFHAIEVTASPNVSIFAKFKQAERHRERQLKQKDPGNGRPILVFKKNNTDLYAMVRWEDLLGVLKELQPGVVPNPKNIKRTPVV